MKIENQVLNWAESLEEGSYAYLQAGNALNLNLTDLVSLANAILAAAPAPSARKPVAWQLYAMDGGTLRVTKDEAIAQRHAAEGHKVTPLYEAAPAPSAPEGPKGKFEAWYVERRGPSRLEGRIASAGQWYYFDVDVDAAWQAWKEAFAAAPAPSDAQDAARYRWLRDIARVQEVIELELGVETDTLPEMDAAIDAAMKSA